MLSFLINSLLSDLSLPEPPWEEIEASLHCLRAAQEAVPEDENTFLPRFFSPEILGRLPTTGDSRTRATTLALLGESFRSKTFHVSSQSSPSLFSFYQATTRLGSTPTLLTSSPPSPTSFPLSRSLHSARRRPKLSRHSATFVERV